ncbi:hypothetical protein LTR94_019878 [Friedmanniomyces endolithicus]|nr:hypothetical protein LTR94_019878 [Friedmanniomyces endolithicus]
MSDKEIQRLAVLQDVRDHRITQVRAAEILNLSTRQITRLLHKLNQDGVSGLAHASRGQPGHRRHDDLLKSKCLSIISEHLLGFGPTLAHEKLSSIFDLNIPVETVRRWMTANELWIPRSKRLKRPYQPRYNRDCFVYIDDATGKLLHLRFCEAETTFDYMLSTRAYIEQYGKPLAFYSDKHSVFRVNQKSSQDSKITQFGRILNELNIDIIFANSPQAKGRVERANRTLQDRLIKEMRLEGIGSIAEANAWLPCFIEHFNQKFAKCARNSKNLHRPLTESDLELDDIFTWQEPRKVTKNLTITYDKCIYLLEPTELNHKLVGQYISFLEYPDGTVAIMHEGRKINYSVFNKLAGLQQNEVVENKRLGSVLAHIQQQHEELEKQNKRSRLKKSMPSRKAQKAAIEQRNLNPVLDSCS